MLNPRPRWVCRAKRDGFAAQRNELQLRCKKINALPVLDWTKKRWRASLAAGLLGCWGSYSISGCGPWIGHEEKMVETTPNHSLGEAGLRRLARMAL